RRVAVVDGGAALLKLQIDQIDANAGGGVKFGGGAFDRWEHNKQVRLELARAKRCRNEFLSERRHLISPFLADGENFFAKYDREALLLKLEKEAAARQAARLASDAAEAENGSAEVGELGEEGSEARDMLVDAKTVKDSLIQLGIISATGDTSPDGSSLALSGQPTTDPPPLQVDEAGRPVMEDFQSMGTTIEQEGDFKHYTVAWPGKKLTID
ncbi:unnamed protein product, partial [Chrysoparadoxa australica]